MTVSHTGVDADEPGDLRPEHDAGDVAPEGSPTTTHAEFGAGRPRLIFKVGADWDGTPPREFDLLDGVIRIGSGDDMDLQLEGLQPFHAEIVHEDNDEYVLTQVVNGDDQNAAVLHELETEGSEAAGPGVDSSGTAVLRTGAPVVLGGWHLSYYREEFADHGRPFGGRQGGEGEHQPTQPTKPQAD